MFKLKSKLWQAITALIFMLSLTLVACGDQPSVRDVQSSVKTVQALSGITPYPTQNPSLSLGGQVGILNMHDFYPSNPGETIQFIVTNPNATSFFTGTCGTVILQRKDADKWLDIAPSRPCAPSGPRIVQITAYSKPYSADFSFDSKVTRPFNGQSWDVAGTYRLNFIYYLNCPAGSDLLTDCINMGQLASDEFQVKSGSTITIQSIPYPNGQQPTATSTPK